MTVFVSIIDVDMLEHFHSVTNLLTYCRSKRVSHND